MEKSEKETLDITSLIKKISIQLFIISKDLEEFPEESKKEASAIIKSLNKIDKELLKAFNIKLSSSSKESALDLFKIMK